MSYNQNQQGYGANYRPVPPLPYQRQPQNQHHTQYQDPAARWTPSPAQQQQGGPPQGPFGQPTVGPAFGPTESPRTPQAGLPHQAAYNPHPANTQQQYSYPQYAAPAQSHPAVPPSQPIYNPQHYPAMSTVHTSPRRSSFVTAPASRAPQPYNPATYQDNSIANAVDRIYGSVNPGPIGQPQQQYVTVPQGSYGPSSAPQTTLASHQYPQHGPRLMPQPTASQRPTAYNNYGASAPLPSRPFPSPPIPMPHASATQTTNEVNARPAQTPSRPRPFSFQLPLAPEPRWGGPSSQIEEESDDEPNWSFAPSIAPQPQSATSSHDVNLDFTQTSPPPSAPVGQQLPPRPLPGLPITLEPDVEPTHHTFNGDDYDRYSDEIDQDELFDEIENAVGAPSPSGQHRLSSSGGSILAARASASPNRSPQSTSGQSPYLTSGNANNREDGHASSPARYGDYSDDSDAEAAAGLEAMRLAAEEDKAADSRRQSGNSGFNFSGAPNTARREDEDRAGSDDGDDVYANMDFSSLAGGYNVPMTHRDDPLELIANHHNDPSGVQGQHPSTSSRGSMLASADGNVARSSSHTSMTEYSYSSPTATAHVDQAGTGGLADPSLGLRKMSFEEGSEKLYYDEPTAAGADMTAGPPDLPYMSSGSGRPLPPPPPDQIGLDTSVQNTFQGPPPGFNPADPNAFYQPHAGYSMNVPRSISLLSHPSTPRPVEPVRAKTDIKKLPLRVSTQSSAVSPDDGDLQTPAAFHLPSLPPGRRFQPGKLTARDFNACSEPWALSGLAAWLRYMAEGESELKEPAILEGLTALFTFKVADMNITIAEVLAAEVVKELYSAEFLVHEEEWLRLGPGSVSGVLYQLTGKGCYAPSAHDAEAHGRCYSRSCQRTVRKIDLHSQNTRPGTDWATFYNLTKEEVDKATKKSVELQNNLHEVVTSEDIYMDNLNVLCTLYRDALKTANPPIISPKRLSTFLRDVFGKVDAVKVANEEHLLPQLKYRQQEQGPWISGISDIFRHWIRKAKAAYIDYAANFPQANFLMKQEEAKNTMFVNFVNEARNNKLSNRLEWASFLRAPITRLQRYTLLLSTVQKNTPPEATTELANLQKAIDEIKAVTIECDSRVAEMGKKAEMYDLHSRLVLRPEMKHVELNLTHLGREILHRGDLQRTGSNRFTLVQTHAILLDNYLVLAKLVQTKEAGSAAKFDVSKMPIPMDLLILESTKDDPVEKSYKGVTAVSSTAKPGNTPEPKTVRNNSSGTIDTLRQTTTNSSMTSVDTTSQRITPLTVLSESSSRDDHGKILYPFRIKHLGREMYTLFAASIQDRKQWCDKILEAKTQHASSLFAQNAEPFKVRILADAAFAYDTPAAGAKATLVKGTPLQRSIADVDRMYGHTGRPGPVCRARVNCATTFRQVGGRSMIAIGTDYGVYLAEAGDVRGWTKAISALRVTQIAVIEEFNLFILISDKTLIAYHLDVVCPSNGPGGSSASETSSRKAPQKISGSRDVTFFGVGRMKDRTLIFYKKGGMSSSTFKVLEPVLHRVAERSRARHFLSKGTLESFREYDEFYIPSDCTALEIFTTTLAIATTKGFEVLNLDKKTPFSVPDLKQPHVATIARRLENVAPLAMFRLSDLEFLCIYEECAVYVNKHGDISRSVVMEFVGRVKAAALISGFLVLFDDDFVQVRDAQTGRLKQVIAGRDVRCLDDGKGNGGQQINAANGTAPPVQSSGLGSFNSTTAASAPGARTIKFALQHPEQERVQIVAELVLDEGRMG